MINIRSKYLKTKLDNSDSFGLKINRDLLISPSSYLSERLEKNKIKKSKLLSDKIICGKNKIIRLIYFFDNKIYDNKNDDRLNAVNYAIITKKYKKTLYFNILIFK